MPIHITMFLNVSFIYYLQGYVTAIAYCYVTFAVCMNGGGGGG